jgi:DNA-binding transcriptional LysR family regulator
MNQIHIQRLDPNLLFTLQVLLEERHVSRAAARLRLTQPAVSHALQRLRAHFDDPLLVRRGQEMVPTPRAMELAGPLRQVLSAIDQLTGPASFDPAQARGTLRIATTDYGLAVVLPPVLARLATAAPNLTIQSTGLSEDTFDHLKTGFLDLALSGQETLGTMQTDTLFVERFVLVTRADHPVAGPAKMKLEDFLAWPHALIDIVHSRLYGIDRKLEKKGVARRVALRVPHMLAAPFFAQSTDLIVPVPERVARMFAESLNLAIHEPPDEVDFGYFDYVQVWHERRDDDPVHRWLRTLVHEAARDIRDAAPQS